jgi:predicted HicB family RNase H-like nuclease
MEGCSELGIQPRKSFNGILSIRIPSEMHGRVATIAENTGTTINAFIRESIEKRLEAIR